MFNRFLDLIWNGLFFSGIAASVFLAAIIFTILLLRKSNPMQVKWFLNFQFVILLILLSGGFGLALANREFISGCLDAFVKGNSSFMATRLLAAAWMSGFLALLTGDLIRVHLAERKAAAFHPMADPGVTALLRQLKFNMGISREIQLCTVGEAQSPFAYGLFRHKIVFPRQLLKEASLKSVLAHELVHVRDRDSLWLFLELFCRRILFWHPLAYVAARLYTDVVEKAADEAAIRLGGISAGDFVKALLEITSLCRTSFHSPMRMGASRGFRETKGRIEAVMELRPLRRSRNLAVLALLPLAVSIAEARGIAGSARAAPLDTKMCMQVTHEKIIESWLRIESTPNKCEK